MKVFENKITSLLKDKEGDLADYRELVNLCFNKPLKQTQTYKEMKSFFDLISIFETQEKEYKISDELFALLKKEVEEMTWHVRHRDILSFVEYVLSL